jgi:hypothetical protein
MFTPEQLEKAAEITEGIAGRTIYEHHPDLEGSRTVLDDFIGEAAKEVSAINAGDMPADEISDGIDRINTSMRYTGGDSFIEATKKLFFGIAAQNSEFTPYEIEQSLEISDQADIWGTAMTKYQENKSLLQETNYGILQKAKDTTTALEAVSNFSESNTAKLPLHQLTKSLLGTAVAIGNVAIPGYVLAGDAKVSFGGKGNNIVTSTSDDGSVNDNGSQSDNNSQGDDTNTDKSQSSNATNGDDPDSKKKLSDFQDKKGKLPVEELFKADTLETAAVEFNSGGDTIRPRKARYSYNENREATEIQFIDKVNLLLFMNENELIGGVLPKEVVKKIADIKDDKSQYILQYSEKKGISFYYKDKRDREEDN